MKLVAYLRTSTAANNGDSLDAQLEACRAWAEREGHKLAGDRRDEGLSGRLGPDERPGLAAALVDLEQGRADGLVVHRLDRLARELHVQEAALATAWAHGARVFEAVEGEVPRDDPADPARKFLRQVIGAAAELERGMIRARLQGGRSRKHRRGGYAGGPTVPLGMRVQGEGRDAVLAPDPDGQAVLRRVVELRDSGLTLQQVVDALNAEGVPTPRGGRWHMASVQRALKRGTSA